MSAQMQQRTASKLYCKGLVSPCKSQKDAILVQQLASASNSLAVQLQQHQSQREQSPTSLDLPLCVAVIHLWVCLAHPKAAGSDDSLLFSDSDLVATVVPVAQLALALLRTPAPAGRVGSSRSSAGNSYFASVVESRGRNRKAELEAVSTAATCLTEAAYHAHPASSQLGLLLRQEDVAQLLMVALGFYVRSLRTGSSGDATTAQPHDALVHNQQQQPLGQPVHLVL